MRMTRPSIVAFRQFYSSALGRKVKQRLRAWISDGWPHHAGQTIAGIGYAIPVLRVLEREKPVTLVALMPADQGAIYWPVHAENRSILADELLPPFAPNTLDRVVMLHAFEYVAQPLEFLQIYWQLLVPGGQLRLIVPNRRGLWARLGATPVAQGTAYSAAQMKELLNSAKFTVREMRSALFPPPSGHPFWLRSWSILETLGSFLLPSYGGVLFIEAEKQIYANLLQPLAAPTRSAWSPAYRSPSTAKSLH